MTEAITFSRQNDAGSRAFTTQYWKSLVLVVVLVLESKALYYSVWEAANKTREAGWSVDEETGIVSYLTWLHVKTDFNYTLYTVLSHENLLLQTVGYLFFQLLTMTGDYLSSFGCQLSLIWIRSFTHFFFLFFWFLLLFRFFVWILLAFTLSLYCFCFGFRFGFDFRLLFSMKGFNRTSFECTNTVIFRELL